MKPTIRGSTLPVLEIELEPGETIVAESGELSWIDSNIELETAATGMGGAKGVFGALKRVVGGGTFFMTEYSAPSATGVVTFATKLPGQILELEVGEGETFLCQRHGFLCGTDEIEITTGLQRKLGAGIFGGAGVVLQRVGGKGKAWFELSGEISSYELAEGESLRVHPGHIGLFEEAVNIEFASIPGIKNKLFGSGLFLAELTGPGRVWLQSLSIANLAAAIQPYLPDNSSGGESGGVGGLIGGLTRE